MQNEVKALEKNGTWTLEYLPEGKRAIDSKWVYKIKFRPNGEVEKYKARLVANGFNQIDEVDYHDIFAPVAKLVTVRTLLATAVKRDSIIHQLDVNNTFLDGDLDEEVYMKIPQGFSNDNETRSITTLVLIYVDAVIITGNNLTKIQETKKQLDDEFSIKDLGQLSISLGQSVKLGCKPSAFPIEEALKLDKGESESRVDATDPRNNHLKAANRVLGYLKANPGQGILLSRAGDPVLTAYCDSDWLECTYTRRSRTGYLPLLGGTPISWRTKNNLWPHVLQMMPSTRRPPSLMKLFGFDGCSVSYMFTIHWPPSYFVITKQLGT
uniref:Integrase, catalytic core n=1 Tax=Tanacetum cinerariifolium TaxID=118510 RepID=A0A6L2N0P2_TANCI|nr:integrase, catalytic core [Tanacetum cinerariifolium]